MILDYMYTYGGPELFVLLTVFILTPLLYVLVLKRLRWRYRLVSIFVLWIASVLIAFTDVYLIAREARRLCREEAGLKVYETVKNGGLIGWFRMKDLSNSGVEYVEYASHGARAGMPGASKLYRRSMREGEEIEEEIAEFTSRYEYAERSDRFESPITRLSQQIVDRIDGRKIGEIVSFDFYPGWLDRRLVGILGFSWTPPRCDHDSQPLPGDRTFYTLDLISAVFPRSGLHDG